MGIYFVLLGFLVVLGIGCYLIASKLGRPAPLAEVTNDTDPGLPSGADPRTRTPSR